MNLEIAFLYNGRRPDARHEFVLGDQLTRTLDEGDQNLQCSTAETESLVAVQQQPLRRKQTVAAEGDRALGRSGGPISQLNPPLQLST